MSINMKLLYLKLCLIDCNLEILQFFMNWTLVSRLTTIILFFAGKYLQCIFIATSTVMLPTTTKTTDSIAAPTQNWARLFKRYNR